MKASRIFLILLLAPLALKADYDLGLSAYQRGDYETAYSEWLKVAISPSGTVQPAIMAESCYALGMLFWVGQGVEQNNSESARWLKRAAELGHPGAQTKLGFLYGSGQGVVQSDYEALKWTQMAANQGDVDAQYNLGVFYRDGQGVARDTELALKWFREAAGGGDRVSGDVITNYEKFGWPIADDESEAKTNVPDQTGLEEPQIVEQSGNLEAESGSEASIPKALEVGRMTADEDWIRQRDPQHYTIQVIALLSKDNLQAFADANPDWAPFAIYQQEWKGKPLFVLLQGDYETIEQAQTAVSKFPAGLQQRKELWVRKFLMVQGLLKNE